jgi:hypothetical protein
MKNTPIDVFAKLPLMVHQQKLGELASFPSIIILEYTLN